MNSASANRVGAHANGIAASAAEGGFNCRRYGALRGGGRYTVGGSDLDSCRLQESSSDPLLLGAQRNYRIHSGGTAEWNQQRDCCANNEDDD